MKLSNPKPSKPKAQKPHKTRKSELNLKPETLNPKKHPKTLKPNSKPQKPPQKNQAERRTAATAVPWTSEASTLPVSFFGILALRFKVWGLGFRVLCFRLKLGI